MHDSSHLFLPLTMIRLSPYSQSFTSGESDYCSLLWHAVLGSGVVWAANHLMLSSGFSHIESPSLALVKLYRMRHIFARFFSHSRQFPCGEHLVCPFYFNHFLSVWAVRSALLPSSRIPSWTWECTWPTTGRPSLPCLFCTRWALDVPAMTDKLALWDYVSPLNICQGANEIFYGPSSPYRAELPCSWLNVYGNTGIMSNEFLRLRTLQKLTLHVYWWYMSSEFSLG